MPWFTVIVYKNSTTISAYMATKPEQGFHDDPYYLLSSNDRVRLAQNTQRGY